MRHYECKCLECGLKIQIAFKDEPYPEYGNDFLAYCNECGKDTRHTRILTRKTKAELLRKQEEQELRDKIAKKCANYGFGYRFVYQSVIIETQISDWCFDYHKDKKTLYHESSIKVNFLTGNYAKAHVQFEGKKLTIDEVIEYIALHDEWIVKQQHN